jgi:hypothetical protein
MDLDTTPERIMTSDEEAKLRNEVESGSMLSMMISSLGWKYLKEKFISRKLDHKVIIYAPPDELQNIRAEQRVLFEMLEFINKAIENSEKAHKKLRK